MGNEKGKMWQNMNNSEFWRMVYGNSLYYSCNSFIFSKLKIKKTHAFSEPLISSLSKVKKFLRLQIFNSRTFLSTKYPYRAEAYPASPSSRGHWSCGFGAWLLAESLASFQKKIKSHDPPKIL